MLSWGSFADDTEKKTSLDDPTVVDDGDKTSGRVNDIINSVETAFKAVDAYNTVVNAKKTFDELKKFKNLKDWENFGASQLKGLVSQYKSCKWSLFTWVSNVSTKMAEILEKCNDRVNMWRTTEPMLISYYKSMGKLSNNTLEIFKDFELSDVVDIDRKWSRKMEKTLAEDGEFGYSFFAFAAQHFPSDYYQTKYSTLFMPYAVQKDLSRTTEGMQAYIEMKDNVCIFNQLPFQTLTYSSDALLEIREIANKAHAASNADPSVSEEEHSMEMIQTGLTTGNVTYNDVMDVNALIQAKRAEISIERTQLQQIFSELQTRYSRLKMRNTEKLAVQYEDMDNTMNKLVNGGQFETIDAARMKRFGQDAGL